MSQGVLPYQYQGQTTKSGMTALGGLPVWLDLAQVAGLSASIGRHLQVRAGSQGWTDSQMVMSLILLQLAAGDCVDDLRVLEGDEGLGRLLRRVEHHGLPRRARRELERRWRKERVRAVPSPSAVFRYLSAFHDWRDGVAAGRVGRARFRKKSRGGYGGQGVRGERREHDPQEA